MNDPFTPQTLNIFNTPTKTMGNDTIMPLRYKEERASSVNRIDKSLECFEEFS